MHKELLFKRMKLDHRLTPDIKINSSRLKA